MNCGGIGDATGAGLDCEEIGDVAGEGLDRSGDCPNLVTPCGGSSGVYPECASPMGESSADA